MEYNMDDIVLLTLTLTILKQNGSENGPKTNTEIRIQQKILQRP